MKAQVPLQKKEPVTYCPGEKYKEASVRLLVASNSTYEQPY
jgi:hypothetical protein